MAERGGFEPPHGSYPPAGIRSQSLQPLGYLSTTSVIITHSFFYIQGFIGFQRLPPFLLFALIAALLSSVDVVSFCRMIPSASISSTAISVMNAVLFEM